MKGVLMALPKRRQSKSRGRKRSTGKGLKPIQLSKCDHCGQAKVPHRVCPHCGYYRKRKVLELAEEKK
jgi:large subunit ribosomal protein L32